MTTDTDDLRCKNILDRFGMENVVSIDKLKDIPDIFKELMYKYVRYTEVSEERIEKVVNGLKNRINYLISFKEKK